MQALANLALMLGVVGGLTFGGAALLSWWTGGQAPGPLAWLGSALSRVVPRPSRRPRSQEEVTTVLLELELQRLGTVIHEVAEADVPNKAARLAATRAAYDHVLLELCLHSDLSVPDCRPPLSHGQRFELESALVGAGRRW